MRQAISLRAAVQPPHHPSPCPALAEKLTLWFDVQPPNPTKGWSPAGAMELWVGRHGCAELLPVLSKVGCISEEDLLELEPKEVDELCATVPKITARRFRNALKGCGAVCCQRAALAKSIPSPTSRAFLVPSYFAAHVDRALAG